jgi:hypothetical protein
MAVKPLSFPTGDGATHASALLLLRQSMATAPKLAGRATVTTNSNQLQTPQTMVNDHDIDASNGQRQPTNDP